MTGDGDRDKDDLDNEEDELDDDENHEGDEDDEESLLHYDEGFDENDAELQAIKNIELLGDVLETAERDDATGEVIIRSNTASGIELVERFRSVEELREFLQEFGWHAVSADGGVRNVDVFGYGGARTVDVWDVEDALDDAEAASLFSHTEPPGTSLFRVQPGCLFRS